MSEVTPNFKPDAEACPCSCGTVGRPQKKLRKDGLFHVQRCPCVRCKGARVRKGGLAAQRTAAKRLGVPMMGSMRPGNEEDYAGLLRMESKAGAQVRPMFTAFLKAESQSEAQRPHGDNRPFVMAARITPQANDGLVVIRESRLQETVYALAVQLGLIEE